MQKTPITVILPVYNEERHIRKCLESVSFAEEVIVVNGESTDNTRAIASEFPIRLIDTPNDFAEGQRLKALAIARHPWVFFIDADERITPKLRNSIEKTIRAPHAKQAYFVRRKNLYAGRVVRLLNPDHQLRLFQKDKIVFPTEIHRKPLVQGEAGTLQGDLIHHFFTTVHDYMIRLNKYTSAESSYASMKLTKNTWELWKLLALRPAARFIQHYFWRRGFMDGYFGFFYSVTSAYYEFLAAAKLLVKLADVTAIRKS